MENENDVKGGIVVEQLKRYAKRLSDHGGDAANAQIEVWYHPNFTNPGGHFDIQFKAFDYRNRRHITAEFQTEDLRDLGKAIDRMIQCETKDGAK